MRKHEAGLSKIETAATLDPANSSYFTALGERRRLLFKEKGNKEDLEQAVTAFNQALSRNPLEADAWKGLGLLYRSTGDTEKAISAFQNSVEIRPFDAKDRLRLADLLLKRRRRTPALYEIAEALESDPDRLDEGLDICADHEIPPRLLRTLVPIEKHPLFGLAQFFEQQGCPAEASRDYLFLCRFYPEDKIFLDRVIQSSLKQNSGLDEALSIYRQRLALHYKGYTWVGLGMLYQSSNRMEKAILAYQNALRDVEGSAPALRRIAGIFSKRGDRDRVLECYDRILEIDPLDADAYFTKGQILAAAGKPSEAIHNYRKAITLSPENQYYSLQLARIYDSRGAAAHALKILDDLLSFSPNSVQAWAEQARIQERIQDYGNATYSWRKVLELDKENESAAQALMRIASTKLLNTSDLQSQMKVK